LKRYNSIFAEFHYLVSNSGNEILINKILKNQNMKSKLLLALLLGSTVSLSAQKAGNQSIRANRTSKNTMLHQKSGVATQSSVNRAEIWTNDFSVPADWTITSEAGPGAWVIGTAIPSGAFLIDPIESTTAANGYALFDSDLDCSGNQITSLTMSGSADCSTYPGVILEFQQQYRRFDDSTFVFVSNDNGTTWVKYPVNETLGNNDASTSTAEVVKVNITPTAGGQANVKVRFQFWSPTGSAAAPGCAYSWMVDDVKLITPPDYELLMTNLFHGDPFLDWEYGTYPLSQVDSVTVLAIVRNEGALAQTATVNYTITRAGTTVNSGSSAEFTIQPFTNDTIAIETAYTADATGNYSVAASVTSANQDIEPSNNAGTSSFVVSNYVYSGLTTLTGTVAYTYSGAATLTEWNPCKITNRYSIKNDVDVKAIDIAVSSASTDNTDLVIELFDDADLTTALSIGDFSISATHPTTAQYFTVLIDQQTLLAGGLYVASMGNEATDKRFLFYGVAGDDDNSTIVQLPDENGVLTWYLSDLTAAVNLNFEQNIGIANPSAPAMNMEVYPNPASNQISWNIKTQEASNVSVSLIDINGKVVFNKSINGKIVAYNDTLSLVDFANGVYTLQVTTNKGTSSQKVVVAH
jgi:hypothetical protein